MSLHASRRRLRVAVSLGSVVALMAVAACGRSENGSQADAAGARDAVMTVTAAPLERGDLTRTISMNGSLYAWQDVIISSEVIPETHRHGVERGATSALFGGFVVMLYLDVALG